MAAIRIVIVASVLCLGSAFAQDEEPAKTARNQSAWRDLVGGAMPELPNAKWLCGEKLPKTLAEMKDRVGLLAFLDTRQSESRDVMIALTEFHQEHAAEGLCIAVIAVDDEKDVKAEFVDRLQAPFPVGVFSGDEKMVPYIKGPGAFDAPRINLFGPDGKVVSHEMPTPPALEKLLEGVWIPTIDRELAAELADARSAYESGWSGVAHELAAKFADSKDEGVARDAQYLISKSEHHAAAAVREALEERKDEFPEMAYGRLLGISRQLAGLAPTRSVDARLKELKDNPRVSHEGKAWAAYEKELDHELAVRRAGGKRIAIELEKIAKALDKLVEKDRRGTAPQFMRKRAEALRGVR